MKCRKKVPGFGILWAKREKEPMSNWSLRITAANQHLSIVSHFLFVHFVRLLLLRGRCKDIAKRERLLQWMTEKCIASTRNTNAAYKMRMSIEHGQIRLPIIRAQSAIRCKLWIEHIQYCDVTISPSMYDRLLYAYFTFCIILSCSNSHRSLRLRKFIHFGEYNIFFPVCIGRLRCIFMKIVVCNRKICCRFDNLISILWPDIYDVTI